jgi:hypothetical protein
MGASSAKTLVPLPYEIDVRNVYETACQAIVVAVNTGSLAAAANQILDLPSMSPDSSDLTEVSYLRPIFTCCLTMCALEPFTAFMDRKGHFFQELCRLGASSATKSSTARVEILQAVFAREAPLDGRTLGMLQAWQREAKGWDRFWFWFWFWFWSWSWFWFRFWFWFWFVGCCFRLCFVLL